ncbi:hypothetical protein AM593_08409, partial [Mytilus galloprovincialis]
LLKHKLMVLDQITLEKCRHHCRGYRYLGLQCNVIINARLPFQAFHLWNSLSDFKSILNSKSELQLTIDIHINH